MEKNNFKNLTVIIPTLNEEKNIGEVILRLSKSVPKARILVVDDGSKDKTKKVVARISKSNPAVRFIDRKEKPVKGLTASAVEGVYLARTPYFVVMDADLQHPPKKIAEIGKALTNYDVVVGTRNRLKVKWPLKRRIISKTATLLGQARLSLNGVRCKDVMSGLFGSRTKLFREVFDKKGKKFQMEGYKVLFDFLKYVPKGTRIGEVYYDFGLRKEGESKIGKRQINAYLRSVFN